MKVRLSFRSVRFPDKTRRDARQTSEASNLHQRNESLSPVLIVLLSRRRWKVSQRVCCDLAFSRLTPPFSYPSLPLPILFLTLSLSTFHFAPNFLTPFPFSGTFIRAFTRREQPVEGEPPIKAGNMLSYNNPFCSSKLLQSFGVTNHQDKCEARNPETSERVSTMISSKSRKLSSLTTPFCDNEFKHLQNREQVQKSFTPACTDRIYKQINYSSPCQDFTNNSEQSIISFVNENQTDIVWSANKYEQNILIRYSSVARLLQLAQITGDKFITK